MLQGAKRRALSLPHAQSHIAHFARLHFCMLMPHKDADETAPSRYLFKMVNAANMWLASLTLMTTGVRHQGSKSEELACNSRV